MKFSFSNETEKAIEITECLDHYFKTAINHSKECCGCYSPVDYYLYISNIKVLTVNMQLRTLHYTLCSLLFIMCFNLIFAENWAVLVRTWRQLFPLFITLVLLIIAVLGLFNCMHICMH